MGLEDEPAQPHSKGRCASLHFLPDTTMTKKTSLAPHFTKPELQEGEKFAQCDITKPQSWDLTQIRLTSKPEL